MAHIWSRSCWPATVSGNPDAVFLRWSRRTGRAVISAAIPTVR